MAYHGGHYQWSHTPASETWTHPTWQRPATSAGYSHFNGYSGQGEDSPRPPKDSPRYNSSGQYSTVDQSSNTYSSDRPSTSSSQSKHYRQTSFTYARTSSSMSVVSEDEIIVKKGKTYVLPGESHRPKYSQHHPGPSFNTRDYEDYRRCDSNDGYRCNVPDMAYFHDGKSYASSHNEPRTREYVNPQPRSRSKSAPRPPHAAGSARPARSHRKATDADARIWDIPPGYSLRHWDPSEKPILLLGSVFDANSLGKWIYDWTVHYKGPATPISEMAGNLWLLLIQLDRKVKHAEETVDRVRSANDCDTLEEFIKSGDRLFTKLGSLLECCQKAMLKAAKRHKTDRKTNAGFAFVKTMFGREKELQTTDNFMEMLKLFNYRFDVNCNPILMDLTQ